MVGKADGGCVTDCVGQITSFGHSRLVAGSRSAYGIRSFGRGEIVTVGTPLLGGPDLVFLNKLRDTPGGVSLHLNTKDFRISYAERKIATGRGAKGCYSSGAVRNELPVGAADRYAERIIATGREGPMVLFHHRPSRPESPAGASRHYLK